jgi:hypothetical protein
VPIPRAAAIRALDAARISWVEAFVGAGVAAVAAAVTAGVAGKAHRAYRVHRYWRKAQTAESTAHEVMLSRASDARCRAAFRALSAAFRAMAAP